MFDRLSRHRQSGIPSIASCLLCNYRRTYHCDDVVADAPRVVTELLLSGTGSGFDDL